MVLYSTAQLNYTGERCILTVKYYKTELIVLEISLYRATCVAVGHYSFSEVLSNIPEVC